MTPLNEKLLARSRAEAAKGLWPHEHSIDSGTTLYRFIDAHCAGSSHAADGPWWFEFQEYQTIKQFALRHGCGLGYAARLFAAILYKWSEVNAVVRAQTKCPLVAWKGTGKQIVVGRDRPLYIPEMVVRSRNTFLGDRDALPKEFSHVIGRLQHT